MKRILFILSLLFYSLCCFSQTPEPFVNPRSSSSITVQDYNLSAIQNLYLPRLRDTVSSNSIDSIGNLIYDRIRAKLWVRDTVLTGGHKWTQIFKTGDVAWGTITGTLNNQTDLQNALNLKFNISDTTNKWVQNVYQRNDSLFNLKNSTETFIHVFSPPITANNGLTKTGNNIQLGGTLIQNTTVNDSSFIFTMTGTNSSETVLLHNTGSGRAIEASSIDAPTIEGTSTNASVFSGISTNGIPVSVTSTNNAAGQFSIIPSNTNSVITSLVLTRGSTGTASSGIGQRIDYYSQTSDGSSLLSNRLISKFTNNSTGFQSSQFIINGANVGSNIDLLTINGNGQHQLNQYTGTNFQTTDTSLNSLVVDGSGNIFKRAGDGGGGTVQTQQSITGDGSSGNKLRLVNDVTTPGNDKLYSTDYSGTRGFIDPDVAWYNLVKAGADNTGVTDISSFLISAMASGQRYIYLPKGTYLLSNTVQMKDSVTIKGDGRQNTIIKLTTNITAFNLTNALGGTKCQFLDLGFQGTFGLGGSNTNQRGFILDSITGCYFHNVGALSIAGYFITIKDNGYLVGVSGDAFMFGNIVSDCYGETNYGGVFCDVRGEYNNIIGCSFNAGTYGVRVAGGNNRVIGNNLSGNQYNLYLEAGSNDGHGTAVGNTLNHAAIANVYATGLIQGFDFTGNMIYSGNITLINCDLMAFHGGDISVNTITVTNCTHTNFEGVKFITEPTWTVTGNHPGVYRYGEASTEGFFIRDPVANSNMRIINNNSLVTLGNSSVDRIMFLNSIVGKSGNADNTRDICAGPSRFDLGSTIGDGVQIYKTGAIGASLAVLDASANYQIYCKTNGNTAIGGNNNNPTARLHLPAGTITASTAPLKIDSGVVLTSPEKGAIESDGDSIYWTNRSSVRISLTRIGSGSNTLYSGDGTLAGARTVSSGGNTLTFRGTDNSDTIVAIINSGTNSTGLYSIGSLFGIDAISSNVGLRAFGTSTGILSTGDNNEGAVIKSNTIRGATIQSVPTSTNTIQEVLRIERGVNGSPGATGLGGSIDYYNKASDNTSDVSTQLVSKWTDATFATRTSQFYITGVNSGTTGTLATFDGNGNVTFGTTNSIVGTSTNNNAVAGNIGEEVNSTISTYTNYTTSATYQNITSITLSAGDWDISGQGTFSSNGATITGASNAIFVISTTTASASGATEGKNISYVPQAALLGTSLESITIAPYRVSLSGSTTYYLNSQATFTIGNPQFVGTIRARRAR